uniref:Sugar-binding transcriptional regulator n=1 Tax=Candidatus Caldatribacterium saccharofermentans TaxID=1454753 RepID=A0A7V4WKV2_9BACT
MSPRVAREEDFERLAKVAELYYLEDLNQRKIAELLGVSPQKVYRMLKRAREIGIVEIRIRRSGEVDAELSQSLAEHFDLQNAVVVRTYSGTPEGVVKAVAQAAASFLRDNLVPYTSVGVAYGRTLHSVLEYLPRLDLHGIRVVQMMGGYGGRRWKTVAIELVKEFASRLGGEPVYLFAPAFAKSPETRDAFLSEKEVQEVLRMAEEVDVALVGIGGMRRETSLLIETGNFEEQEIEELVRRGAVGAICGTFFNIDGEVIMCDLDKKRIAVDVKRIRERGSRVIGIAGGMEKKEAILGALRGKWLTDLVTDAQVGRWLLSTAKGK